MPPVCVHTTYQYGDGDKYAYGKRERLRDAGLWLVDPASLGTFWEPSRNLLGLWLVDPASRYTSGSYLQLTSSLARQLSPNKAELLLPALRDEAHCAVAHLKQSRAVSCNLEHSHRCTA